MLPAMIGPVQAGLLLAMTLLYPRLYGARPVASNPQVNRRRTHPIFSPSLLAAAPHRRTSPFPNYHFLARKMNPPFLNTWGIRLPSSRWQTLLCPSAVNLHPFFHNNSQVIVLGRTTPKWSILCRVKRQTNYSINLLSFFIFFVVCLFVCLFVSFFLSFFLSPSFLPSFLLSAAADYNCLLL